jgi:hypothetical protein
MLVGSRVKKGGDDILLLLMDVCQQPTQSIFKFLRAISKSASLMPSSTAVSSSIISSSSSN